MAVNLYRVYVTHSESGWHEVIAKDSEEARQLVVDGDHLDYFEVEYEHIEIDGVDFVEEVPF